LHPHGFVRHGPLSKIAQVFAACIALAFAGATIAQTNSESCWPAGPLVFPAGDKEDVIQRTVEFLVEQEKVPAHPYWPGGSSGITIGVGWDIGQHTKEDVATTWSKLPPTDIGLLQNTAKKTGATASQLLPQRRACRLWVGSGSGPGVALHAPNDCCTSITGHSKLEGGGLQPATLRH
jgi:hypothetical protein